jgi:prolyl oligopeptidase
MVHCYKKVKICVLFCLLFPVITFAQQQLRYPVTHRGSITNIYFGTTVADPYRSLEDENLPETKKWVNDETAFTEGYVRRFLDKYSLERNLELNSYASFGTITRSGGYYFDYEWRIIEEGPQLFIKKKLKQDGIPVITPTDYATDNRDNVVLGTFAVSEDNKYIAFCLSHNGSDWQEIRVKSLYPFHDQEDVLRNVKFSNIAWSGNGFFYTRYSAEGTNILKAISDKPAIYYHRLGTEQSADKLVFDNKDNPLDILHFSVVASGKYLVIYSSHREGQKPARDVFFINLKDNAAWEKHALITSTANADFEVLGTYREKFLVKTTLDAPRGRLLLFDPETTNDAEEFIGQYDEVLHDAKLAGDKLVCLYLKDIDYFAVTFDSMGKVVHKTGYPVGASVDITTGDNQEPEVLLYYRSFLHPPVVYVYDTRTLKESLVQQTEILYDYRDFETKKVYYTAKDGAKIPMVLAYKKGVQLNGRNPTILYGYGGYGITLTPFFDRGFLMHMQSGGIVAVPCLRGGGEYGEDWHRKGSMFNKQNVFDDFICAAEYLCAEKYTCKDKLAIMGGSNGGLLVAAVINQRPDICKVAIAQKGVYDMLRYHKFTIGHAWQTEYGTSDDSLQFLNLYRYSPLHNIKDTAYPATLIITADHDDRVVPLHAYKYAATLQEKSKGQNPVLLFTERKEGHNADNLYTESIIYSFIYGMMDIDMTKVRNAYYKPAR